MWGNPLSAVYGWLTLFLPNFWSRSTWKAFGNAEWVKYHSWRLVDAAAAANASTIMGLARWEVSSLAEDLKFWRKAVSRKAGSADAIGGRVDVEVGCWTVSWFVFVAVSANCHLLGFDDLRMVVTSLCVGGIDAGGNLGNVSGMSKMLRPE